MVNKDSVKKLETRSRSFPINMDDKWADSVWSSLKGDIEEILHTNCYSSLEFEKLYRNAYTMVLHKFGEKLYRGLRQVITHHLETKVQGDVLNSPPEDFLSNVIKAWNEHKTFMLLIQDIFMYVDRVYVTQNNVDCIYNLGLKVFREELICHGEIRRRLSDVLLEQITLDRKGEDEDRPAIVLCYKMLMELGVGNRQLYEEILEVPLLVQTGDFYHSLSLMYLEENSASCSYVERVEDLVQKQSLRIHKNPLPSDDASNCYLDFLTEFRIREIIEEEMINKHVTAIVEMVPFGVVDCLRQQKKEDLHCMYKLLSRVSNGVSAMVDCVSAHLRQEGQTLIASPQSRVNGLHFVQSLLDLKDKYDELLVESLDNNTVFKAKILSDFEYLLSLNAEAAEHVSLFIETKMRSSLTGLVDQLSSSDSILDKAFVLFHCLEKKDEFEHLFKLNLAKRLADEYSVLEDVWKLLNESIQQAKPDVELETTGEPYLSVKHFICSHLKTKVRSVVITASACDSFISSLNEAWNRHKTLMVVIRDILIYLNQIYAQQVNVVFVYRLGMALFSEEIVLCEANRNRLRAFTGSRLLESVALERKGQTVDRLSIKADCEMLMAFGCGSRIVYEEVFETPFIAHSSQFYRTESEKLLLDTSAPVYVNIVEALVYEEAQRAKQCLDESTEQWIVSVVEEEMIRRHLETIVNMKDSGVVHIFKNQQTADFLYMYKLLSRVCGGEKAMISCLSAYVREEGKVLINSADEMGPVRLVQNILDLKERHDSFIATSLSFENGSAFRKALSSDFEYFLNLNPKSPEHLSLFIDEQLRQKESKTADDTDTDRMLEKSLILFRFLHSKDVFEHYYKQHLAKRLLLNRSAKDENEKNFISKLKLECGSHFTLKMEGMIKDVSVSALTMGDFSSQRKSTSTAEIDLSVRVLTAGFWPLVSPSASIALPMEARSAFEEFHSFYMAKHNGRLLTLQPGLGSAELSAVFYGSDRTQSFDCSFHKRRYVFQVSTYQMCILLLFNTKDTLSYEEIATRTNIPLKELNRALQSLTNGKSSQRVLSVDQQSTEFFSTSAFLVNENFHSNLNRVKIQAVATRSDADMESKGIPARVDEDRKHEIEAALVRIMKSYRTLQHDSLMTEVTDELKNRFIPSQESIKKRIEGLIERDYILRASTDRNKYIYVA